MDTFRKKHCLVWVTLVWVTAALLWGVSLAKLSTAVPPDGLEQQISRLVGQLNDDQSAIRDQAEEQLLELGGNDTGAIVHFLDALPESSDRMPPAVQERLRRIRKQVEDRLAQSSAKATTVTLHGDQFSLPKILATIEQQTGNRLVDHRDEFGQDPTKQKLRIDFQAEPFWSALDQILDQAQLGIYNYAGEDALSLVASDLDEAPRYGRACYSGPFRLEVLNVQANRNQRKPGRHSLKLGLEVTWEPRLQPIALSQPLAETSAVGDNGQPLKLASKTPVLSVEVQSGSQAVEFVLPFELPPRNVEKITTLKGTIHALMPGRRAKFRFADLATAKDDSQSEGGVTVTLNAVRKNGEIWEVHMRMALEKDSPALESHRGWVFQNMNYIVDVNGEKIDHIGSETTLQTASEVGIVYLFDLPTGVENLTWIYETPASIVEMPIKFELTDVPLP